MASSTLHSDTNPSTGSRWPRWALQLAAVAFATWAVCAVYSLRLNPEVAFYRQAHAKKQAWLQSLRATYPTNILVCGGSSCASGFRAARLREQHDLPVANLGLGAGMGTPVLTQYALDAVRAGDTLVIALEQGLLIDPVSIEPLGVQFALAIGQPSLTRQQGFIDWPSSLFALRPGGYHTFTMLGKLVSGQRLYRYFPQDFKADGWQEITERRPFTFPPPTPLNPDGSGKAWLARLREECLRRNARLVLTLPWQYAPPETQAAMQRENLRYLRQLVGIVPLLREPSLGINSVRDNFGDTVVHLTPDAAARRSDEFAVAFKAWRLWTEADIDATLASLP
jgi:hypothetical protein